MLKECFMTISGIPGQNEIFRGDIELSRERFRDCSDGNYITFNICPLGLTTPEQELLAKYLLQQLTSNNPDPILARLVGEEEDGEILAGEQSQTIATIVPAPPGLSTAGSKQHQTCELVSWSVGLTSPLKYWSAVSLDEISELAVVSSSLYSH